MGTKFHVGCHFFDSFREEEARPGSGTQAKWDSHLSLPSLLLWCCFREGCPLVRPLKTHCSHLICHGLSLFLKTKTLCVVRLQVKDSSILSIIWQTSFSSVGTFALCDGDFPRWGFYSGPRYGVVTAGGDTARNARSGGGASFRVSVCLRWQCGGETGHGVPSVSCVALELTFLMTSNYLKIQ